MVFFNPIGSKAVQPIGGKGSTVGGAKPVSTPKSGGVDAFTPSFGAGASSQAAGPSVADIVANVGKQSNSQARSQLSGGTLKGLDSMPKMFDALG